MLPPSLTRRHCSRPHFTLTRELRLLQENLEKARADYRKLQSKTGGLLSTHMTLDAEGELDACSAAAAQTCSRAQDQSSQIAEQHAQALETVAALKLEIAALRALARPARAGANAQDTSVAADTYETTQREQLQVHLDEINTLKLQVQASQAQAASLRQALEHEKRCHEEALRPASGGDDRAAEPARGARRAGSRAEGGGGCGGRGRGTTNPFDEPIPLKVCEQGDCTSEGQGGDEQARMQAARELQAANETIFTQQQALDALRQQLAQLGQAHPQSYALPAQGCAHTGNRDAAGSTNEHCIGAMQGGGKGNSTTACASNVGMKEGGSDGQSGPHSPSERRIEAQFALEGARVRLEELAGEVRELERKLEEEAAGRVEVERERAALREEAASVRQELERAGAERMDLEKVGRFLEHVNLELMRR